MDLTTERLVLRSVDPGDADWITREIVNPNVHRWLSSVPRPYAQSDAHAFIEKVRANPLYRVIILNGAPIGLVSLTDRGLPELGYWLQEAAWGQGVMTEAAHALLTHFFASNSGPVTSGWLDGNAGSEAVLRKLGFKDTGTRMDFFHYHGQEMLVHRVRLEGFEHLQAPPRRAKREAGEPQ